MKYLVEIAGTTFTIEIDADRVLVDGQPVAVSMSESGGYVRRVVVGGRSLEVVAEPGAAKGQWQLAAAGSQLAVQALDERTRTIRGMMGKAGLEVPGAGTVRAPMPGLVLRILAKEGDTVAAGAGLIVVEAMKMENELKAPGAGMVGRVHVSVGDKVEKGASLMELT